MFWFSYLPYVIGAFIVIVVGYLVYVVGVHESAKNAYYRSLEALQSDPHNSEIRDKTLRLGQRYAALAKNGGTFNEVTLTNDINAACGRRASTAAVAPAAKASPDGKGSVEERLAKIESLHTKGLVSDQEYDRKRREILDEI